MELFEKARSGNLDAVKRLIQQGDYVNAANRNNQTVLYCACKTGRTEVAESLLDIGASVSLGAKPLIAAVRNNNYDCVKLLLQHNASINCTNRKRESPMSVALEKYHYSIILLLLQYGAIPSASLSYIEIQLLKHAKVEHARTIQKLIDKNFINLTSESTFLAAFSFAFKRGSVELAERMLSYDSHSKIEQLYPDAAYYSAKNNWPTVLSELFRKGVDINARTDGQTPLYVACQEGHEYVVILLLNNGANPNIPNTPSASKYCSLPLQIAVQRGNTTIFDKLLENGAKFNQFRQPLLHIACSGADEWKNASETGEAIVERVLSIIRLLLQQGVNVNAISDVGDTALYYACTKQQMQVVQILLEAGADVNLTSKRLYPLMAACDAGNAELISLLLKAGADVKCSKSNNETCLHAVINAYSTTTGLEKPMDTVSKLDIVNTIKSLLDVGVDVNARCSQGETVLYRASKAGHEDIVQLLLEAGAETSGSTTRHPLYAACEHGHTQIVNLLLQNGADSNASSTTSTAPRGPSLLLSLVLGQVASSLPICFAVKKGYTDIVNSLLTHGADVNKRDQRGKSALIYFIESLTSQRRISSQVLNPLEEKDLNILKSMLLAGGDVNKPSGHDGYNALHIASSSGMCDLMMELLQYGANCNHLTSSGKSALDLACENGHEAAVELLLKNGAEPDRETATYFGLSAHSINDLYQSQQSVMPVLCMAAKNGSETMVKMLLKYGADVNASDKKGNTALHLAKTNAIIEMLLNVGTNVNATNDKTETALSVVCGKQQTDANVVEMLLKFGADPNTCFPLHAACKNNDPDIVRLLLAYGADANLVKGLMSDRLGVLVIDGLWIPSPTLMEDIEHSPLCIACKNGNIAMADCLLENGADATFVVRNGKTPLHFAVERLGEATNSEEYDPLVTLLLQHNAAVNVVCNTGETPLYLACMKGRTGVVKQLVDCKADVGLTVSNSNKYPLMTACERKFRDVAMMLLDCGADANVSRPNDKQTPLKLTATNGDVVLVKQLIACGADVNQMQNTSDTALHAAVVGCKGLGNVAFNRHNIVQRLLKSGAETNALNHRGETPLDLACKPTDDKVNIDIVRTLLEHGSDPNIGLCTSDVGSSSWSHNALPPLSASASCGNNELVMLLIKFGARLDHSDFFGRTALHFAVDDMGIVQHTSTAETLLSAGADANVMDKTGFSPLCRSCVRGNTEFVKLLLSRGANPNIGTINYPIHEACRRQHYDSVKLLLEYNADLTVRDQNGKTALHCVLESELRHSSDSDKRTALIQLLLEGGANTNATLENGESPFYIVCSKGLASIAKKMLDCGAKMDGNSGKKLPLNVACRNKHLSVVQLLLTYGADPNVQEEGDEDRYYHRYHCTLPLHTAAADDNTELVELLLKHGAKINVADIGGNTVLHHAIERHHPRAAPAPLPYAYKVAASSSSQSVLDILLVNKADVNAVNSSGETPLYKATSRGLLHVVSKLKIYGGDPNKGSLNKNPLAAACLVQNVELVDMLLKDGADPNLASTSCNPDSKHELPLFVAVDKGNSDIIVSLLNAGASVNAVNHDGRRVVCFAAEKLTKSLCFQSTEETEKKISTIRLLLQHGADFNMLMSDGHSPLYLAVTALAEVQRLSSYAAVDRYRTSAVELLQLMVKHGAMLQDSSFQLRDDTRGQSLINSGTLTALATFDGKHEFIVDLFRAGAGFQLMTFCCNAVATSRREAKSIRLCQAAILTGYSPTARELQNLQLASASDTLLKQLLNWLNEDRQQVPSLLRQCRVAIRRQLSVAVHYQTVLPVIDKLPLPNELKKYLKFDGSMSDVDLSVNKELQTSVENRHQLLSPYNSQNSEDNNSEYSDFEDYYDYSAYDSDNKYFYCDYSGGSDSDDY